MKPFFTVLITAYNYGCYVEEAIRSVLDQSLPREQFEVIVIDDGSTDDTALRVARFGEAIRYFYQENAGQAAAFNAGIAHAAGEFIAFLDADDVWHPEKLAYMKTYLEANAAVDLLYHSLTMVDMHGEVLGVHPKYCSDRIVFDPLSAFPQEGLQEAAATSGIICRLRTLEKLWPLPSAYRICADSYIAVTAPLVVSAIGFIARPFTFYRIHTANVYSSYDTREDRYLCRQSNVLMDKVKLDLQSVEALSSKLGLDTHAYCAQYRFQLTVQEVLLAREHSGACRAMLLLLKSRRNLCSKGYLNCVYRLASISFRLTFGDKIFNAVARNYIGSALYRHIHNCLNSPPRQPVHD